MLDWKVTDTNRDTKKEQRFEQRLDQRLDQTHTATYREKRKITLKKLTK